MQRPPPSMRRTVDLPSPNRSSPRDGTVGALQHIVDSLQARTFEWGSDVCEEDVHAVATLGRAVLEDPTAAASVAGGAILTLAKLLCSGSLRSQRVTLATLLVVVRCDPSTHAVALDAGIYTRLRFLMATTASSVARLATALLRTLLATHDTYILAALRGDVSSTILDLVVPACLDNAAYAKLVLTTLAEAIGAASSQANRPTADGSCQEVTVEAFAKTVLIHCVDHHRVDAEPFVVADSLVHAAKATHKTSNWGQLLVFEDLVALLAKGDEVVARLAVEAGLVQVCASQLRSDTETLRSHAALILGELIGKDDSIRHALLDAVSVDALVESLAIGNRPILRLLGSLLVGDTTIQASAVAAGVIPSLVAILGDCRVGETALVVRALLSCIHQNEGAQAEAIHAGAIEVLLQHLGSLSSPKVDILEALYRLLETDHAGKDVFNSTDGSASALVEYLTEGTQVEQCWAVEAVAALAVGDTVAQHVLTDAGAVQALIRVLCSANYDAIPSAGKALGALVLNHRRHEALLGESSVVRPLVQLVRTGASDIKLKALSAIRSVTRKNAVAKTAFARDGVIEPLIRVLASKNDRQRSAASRTIDCLVHRHPLNQLAVVRAGVFPPLTAMLQTGSLETKETAARTIIYISQHCERATRIVAVEAGVLQALVDVLKHAGGEPMATINGTVARAIDNFVIDDSKAQEVAVLTGAVGALVKQLQVGPAECIRQLSYTLAAVVSNHLIAKQQALEANGVTVLVGLLRSVETSDASSVAACLCALCSILEDCPSAKKALIAAGGIDALRDLLQHENTRAMATELLWDLLSGSVDIIEAVWTSDIVELVVDTFQQADEIDTKVHALAVLWIFLDFDMKLPRIIELLPLQSLFDFIDSGPHRATIGATIMVWRLTSCDEAKRSLAIDHGIVDVAIDVIETAGNDDAVRSEALLCLAILLGASEPAQQMAVRAGAVGLLCELMQSQDLNERLYAAAALASIQSAQDIAIDNGVLSSLLQLLTSNDNDERSTASQALANLVMNHPRNQSAAIDAGVLPLLVDALWSVSSTKMNGDESGKMRWHLATAHAIEAIVKNNPRARDAAIAVGIEPALESAQRHLLCTLSKSKPLEDLLRAIVRLLASLCIRQYRSGQDTSGLFGQGKNDNQAGTGA